ncbi:MAG: hypothetical protein LBO80_09885, partial [Treponema sp.]|nr:hypothetical protein [Treponema sp.]
MKITREQREKIMRFFPKQRGNIKVDLTPSARHNGKRELQQKRRIKMGKQDKERRVYTREFKAE